MDDRQVPLISLISERLVAVPGNLTLRRNYSPPVQVSDEHSLVAATRKSCDALAHCRGLPEIHKLLGIEMRVDVLETQPIHDDFGLQAREIVQY